MTGQWTVKERQWKVKNKAVERSRKGQWNGKEGQWNAKERAESHSCLQPDHRDVPVPEGHRPAGQHGAVSAALKS